jgi:hypothetical protein
MQVFSKTYEAKNQGVQFFSNSLILQRHRIITAFVK